ncbi:F510_1955 family glycosylhydrolase [Nocardioides piscis]|uniref:Exo-alpha-sialidase n=1 Tax=Nocardioides piscis TaxID=2714938 RepID=A0A6G7YGJ5_9ACTN|nr:sialidase family protein [Nocardioides piscis]QIK75796.1 exo-alpha-sialidase [Nocardioides piscis]
MLPTGPRVLVTAALVLTSLTGCGTGSDEETGQGAGGLPVVPAEAGHVHGMALNAADGLLYLGTHGGTMLVQDDSISRVGDSTIDLMGFAAAGPDHFYASGHPGPGDDLPNPVGLIESTDGGETWSSLSLSGEVDFHTLGAAGDQVYGFGGELLTSANGEDWTPGADDVAPASLAVDPSDGDRVVATTEHGPTRSEDAGQTFTHLDGAPLLLFVAWPTADALWGVGVDGTVHLSSDAGQTWQARGAVDSPAAFAAGEDDTLAVATETQIVVSRDGGESFEAVAEITAAGH